MKTIYKYPLTITDLQTVQLPLGALPLSIQLQGSILCLWALVNPEIATVNYTIRIVGTGHDFSDADGYYHLDTFQIPERGLVFHAFVKQT